MIFRRLRLTILLLLVCGGASAAGLQRTPDFYQGSAVVSSRSVDARELATRDALSEVLVRITGDVSVSLTENAGFVLSQASRFVRTYRYEEARVEAVDENAAPDMALRLVVDFDGAGVLRAVKDNGLPIWDELRPISLVWVLGPGDSGGRSIWNQSEIEGRLPALANAAKRRGVPVRFPAMDSEDKASVRPYDLVGEDRQRLDATAARYDARHQLIVRLTQSTPNLWEAQWSVFRDGEAPLRWASVGDDANAAVAQGFNAYADHLAGLYALKVSAGWVQTSRLRIVGVSEVAQYARVMAFLGRINLVQSVQPVEVIGGDVVFLVQFEGEISDLQRSIEVGDLLERAPEPEPPLFQFAPPPATDGMAAPGEPAPMATAPPLGDGFGASDGASSSLSFFAVTRRPELRYRLRP